MEINNSVFVYQKQNGGEGGIKYYKNCFINEKSLKGNIK